MLQRSCAIKEDLLEKRIRLLERELAALRLLEDKGLWAGIGQWAVLWLACAVAAYFALGAMGLLVNEHGVRIAAAIFTGLILMLLLKEPRASFQLILWGIFSLFANLAMGDGGDWDVTDFHVDSSDLGEGKRERRRIATAIAKREYQLKRLQAQRQSGDPGAGSIREFKAAKRNQR